jgi:multidrug efflux pump subunit AcrB
LRLRDVARVELGSQSYEQLSMLDGKPVAGIRVFLQTGANALDTADRIRKRMDELARQFPPDVAYDTPFDTTRFVRSAIGEVRSTLFEAALLVAVVVFLFLGSWRATLIPMIAVPVSLIGACAGLWVMGYGINILTLFAMVIAIGIVVDDAIVVLENAERLMREQGLSPFDAAKASVREVAGAIVAIVCVLVCVFLPVAFLGGIAGVLYRQFAVTVAALGHPVRLRRAHPDPDALRAHAQAARPCRRRPARLARRWFRPRFRPRRRLARPRGPLAPGPPALGRRRLPWHRPRERRARHDDPPQLPAA